jgi:hypothetical protein
MAQNPSTQTGLAGMTVAQDLAADLRGRYGLFITKLGNQYVLVEAVPGHSIKSAIAIPDVPSSWMTFQLGPVSRQSQQEQAGKPTQQRPAQARP